MRRILVLALAALTSGTAAIAEEGTLREVIGGQIAAFQADDFAAAFDHASPAIRAIFGTPERFGAMVRQGYSMVHRPEALRFLDARGAERGVLQRLLVTDEAGRLHLLEYEMIEVEGQYLINGVRILRGVDAGV